MPFACIRGRHCRIDRPTRLGARSFDSPPPLRDIYGRIAPRRRAQSRLAMFTVAKYCARHAYNLRSGADNYDSISRAPARNLLVSAAVGSEYNAI